MSKPNRAGSSLDAVQGWARRAAIAIIVAIATWALPTVASPPGHLLRVGILEPFAPSFDAVSNPAHRAFVEGLRELGYEPGRNVIFEYRSGLGGGSAELAKAASELLASKIDVLVAYGARPILAAAEATRTVPIVMVRGADVVETGLVASLARPGRNLTGLAVNAAEIAAKRVQLLKEAVPGLSRAAILWNASIKSMMLGFQNIEQASPALGVTVQSVRVGSSDEFDRAFVAISDTQPQGLVVLFGPLRGNDLPRIVEFTVNHRLPTIFELDRGESGGGLMEFGASNVQMSRRAAAYVDKIANGADPAGIPVEEPTSFELVINLKAAKTMGLVLPQSLLIRANKVIE
jgi:putative ABC transport system substrate-binding protein